MIQWMKNLWPGKESRKPEVRAIEVDQNNIYVRLKLAMDKVDTSQIHLVGSPVSLGRIDTFTDTLSDFLKSLLEINVSLKENKHIENNLFYIKNLKSVKLDEFLFVKDGYYVDNAQGTLQKVLEQIDLYYVYMNNADQVLYGVMEHNHRQLFTYTETLIQLLHALLDHFSVS